MSSSPRPLDRPAIVMRAVLYLLAAGCVVLMFAARAENEFEFFLWAFAGFTGSLLGVAWIHRRAGRAPSDGEYERALQLFVGLPWLASWYLLRGPRFNSTLWPLWQYLDAGGTSALVGVLVAWTVLAGLIGTVLWRLRARLLLVSLVGVWLIFMVGLPMGGF